MKQKNIERLMAKLKATDHPPKIARIILQDFLAGKPLARWWVRIVLRTTK